MGGPARERQLLDLVETGWAADGRGWGFGGELSSLSQPTCEGHGSGVSLRNSWGEHEGPSWTLATQSILLAMPTEESNALRGCA